MEKTAVLDYFGNQVQFDEMQPQQQTLLDVAPAAVGSRPVSVAEVAGGFNGRATPKRLQEVGEILEMLAELGQIVENQGKFAQ